MSEQDNKPTKITPEIADAVSNKIKQMQNIEYEPDQEIDLLELEDVSGGIQAAWKIVYETTK